MYVTYSSLYLSRSFVVPIFLYHSFLVYWNPVLCFLLLFLCCHLNKIIYYVGLIIMCFPKSWTNESNEESIYSLAKHLGDWLGLFNMIMIFSYRWLIRWTSLPEKLVRCSFVPRGPYKPWYQQRYFLCGSLCQLSPEAFKK